jgi:hypothetical protein
MKYLMSAFLTFFLLNGAMFAQSNDSTKAEKTREQVKTEAQQKEQKQQQEQEQKEQKLEGFIDQNGNGIDDRLEQGKDGKGYGKGKKGQKDRFIDLDGDGICDGKESAVGLRKMYQRRKGQAGKK